MTKAEIEKVFDDATTRTGGIVKPTVYDAMDLVLENQKYIFDRRIDSLRNRFLPGLPDIHFNFINNPNLNAQAFIKDGHWFIGMNEGTIFIIKSLFFRMLSDSKILTWIGNSEIEDNKPPLNTYWNLNFDDLLYNGAGLDHPKDPTRALYAQLLAEIAIDFLFFHEFTHLSHGHVGFINNKNGILVICEFEEGEDNLSDEYILTRQTLEYDADSGAVSDGWARVWGNVNNLQGVHEKFRCFYEDLEGSVFTWWYSIHSLFQLFDVQKLNFNDFYKYYHPQPMVRSRMIELTLLEYLKKYLSEDAANEMVTRLIKKVIHESKTSYEAITGFYAMQEYLGNILHMSHGEGHAWTNDYLNKLTNHWKILRPQLLVYAIEKNLAH